MDMDQSGRLHWIWLAAALAGAGCIALLYGCASGPASSEKMIHPQDQAAYARYVAAAGGDLREGWFAWRSAEMGRSVEQLRQADGEVSATPPPFASDDLWAVGRGALVYRQSCAVCHGREATGLDKTGRPLPGGKDFTHPHMRMALSMDDERLGKWFESVRAGVATESGVMPAMGEQLTREQIWLALQWLASDRKLEARVSP